LTRLRLPRPSQVENRSGQIAWYINRPIRNVLDKAAYANQNTSKIVLQIILKGSSSRWFFWTWSIPKSTFDLTSE
ncbi:MAG: hypothetical protein ACI932_002821, partial [Paracoccaceae bacterium]